MPRQEASTDIIVYGDSGVGKTQLLRALKGESFQASYHPTMFYQISTWRLSAYHSVTVWDVSPTANNALLLPTYCLNARVAIYCIDLTAVDSSIEKVSAFVNTFLTAAKQPKIIVYLGTKADLLHHSIDEEVALKLYRKLESSASLRALKNIESVYLPTSAKKQFGIALMKQLYYQLLNTHEAKMRGFDAFCFFNKEIAQLKNDEPMVEEDSSVEVPIAPN